VRGRVIIELECLRERVEHLCGRVLVTALLETDVVIDADAGKHRDLLAPEPVHSAAVADLRKLDVLGTHELPPRAKVLADRILSWHGTTIRLFRAVIVALALPGSAEPLSRRVPCPRIDA
jgi:hypothetical protein